MVALRERDVLEQRAGVAIRAMHAEGLTLADVATWTDGETSIKEVTRLADITAEEEDRP